MATDTKASPQASWLPMIIILLAQIQMALDVNALPVSIGPISEDLHTTATAVGTALVMSSLFVAAFVMLGAKIGKLAGARLIFQHHRAHSRRGDGHHGLQPKCGDDEQCPGPRRIGSRRPRTHPRRSDHGQLSRQAAGAGATPGLLAGAPAVAGVLAFLIAGFLGTVLSWRYSFGLLIFVAAAVFLLSFRLKPVERQSGVKIDAVGAILAAISIILMSLGFNNLNNWGIVLAGPGAPFNLLGISPAPIMIVLGVVLGQGFFRWSQYRQKMEKSPLLSLEVLDSKKERAAIFALLMIGALGPAVNFLIPLYIQIVQGRTTLQTAIYTVPYTLAIFTSAVSIVRLYSRLTPRQIGTFGFSIVSAGLTILAFAIRNEWGTPFVILGLIVLGLGEGALLTLLFNVMVSASPKTLAGDVGTLRHGQQPLDRGGHGPGQCHFDHPVEPAGL